VGTGGVKKETESQLDFSGVKRQGWNVTRCIFVGGVFLLHCQQVSCL